MLATLRTATVLGVDACPVCVEVDISFGLPGFTMVGLPDASVRESRDRVRSAIRNSGFQFPPHRITVNLAPADIRKAGAAFDLPIALGILAAQGIVERRHITDLLVIGELSLDGAIHAARGVLPIAAAARRDGLAGVLLPSANAGEAAIVRGLGVCPVASLVDAVAALNASTTFVELPAADAMTAAASSADLGEVRGQLLARRALEIACAGNHNLLLIGPPGSGKTMMARRIPGILPPLTFDEALEVTAVHSVAGMLRDGAGLVAERPFRAPHHTVSQAALVGGGSQPRPGEVSLAHHGVLFLDEVLEFRRSVLEVLRQPLEDGYVIVARAARTVRFPARFVLVAASNPCPCGYAGSPYRECRCTPQQVAAYRSRMSGPLRDRMDLSVDVGAVLPEELTSAVRGEASADVRARVVAARARQRARAGDDAAGATNAALTHSQLAAHCGLDSAGTRVLAAAARSLGLSARGYDRVRRVARTIADLEGAGSIAADHVAEALQFRPAT